MPVKNLDCFKVYKCFNLIGNSEKVGFFVLRYSAA